MSEITMSDVRLMAGEGKLSAHDVLAACNAVLRMRNRAPASNLVPDRNSASGFRVHHINGPFASPLPKSLPLEGFAQPAAEAGWQPIDTAPKDGTPIEGCYHDDPETDALPVTSAFWSRISECWYSDIAGKKVVLTHWRKLSAPPVHANHGAGR